MESRLSNIYCKTSDRFGPVSQFSCTPLAVSLTYIFAAALESTFMNLVIGFSLQSTGYRVRPIGRRAITGSPRRNVRKLRLRAMCFQIPGHSFSCR